jgi:kumamolisin
VVLSGRTHKLIEAFGATAAMHQTAESPPRRFRHRSESLFAPPEIAAILRGVFGIHQWPRSRAVGNVHSNITPLSAGDIAIRYEFPSTDGSGEVVGVLQLRGTFKPDDFTKCMQDQGVAAKLPTIKRVDDAELVHGIVTDKDLESATDTQIVGALAPGAQIVIYAAPDDERGVLDAIRTALFPKDGEPCPSVLSISFGFPEQLWTPVALTILDELFTVAALLGVSIFCSSGDHGAETGYDGQPHVLAPASSAFAHACGGTDITSGNEIAWSQTGGGFSDRDDNPVPPWQGVVAPVAASYNAAPRRGVPDFAAQVLPGHCVFVEGSKLPMSGTSTIAPMWAALTARLNQRIGRPIGFFAPLLYGAPAGSLFRDVTSGENDRFHAQAGWNPCTGLGVPIGSAIENALRPGS